MNRRMRRLTLLPVVVTVVLSVTASASHAASPATFAPGPGKVKLIVTTEREAPYVFRPEGFVTGAVHSPAGGTTTFACDDSPSCTYWVDEGSTVDLMAHTERPVQFDHWMGACKGRAATCSIVVNRATSLTAVFGHWPRIWIPVIDGLGRVVSSDGQINCRGVGTPRPAGKCSHYWDLGTVVTLTAIADPGRRFYLWRGVPQCEGSRSPVCVVTPTERLKVRAFFSS